MTNPEGFIDPGLVSVWIIGTIILTALVTGLVAKVSGQARTIDELKKEIRTLKPF
jgi:L-lactate permease